MNHERLRLGYIISPFFYSWPISLFLFSFFNSLNRSFFSDIHFKFAFAQCLSVARVYYKPIFLFLKTENSFFYSTKTLKNIFLFLINTLVTMAFRRFVNGSNYNISYCEVNTEFHYMISIFFTLINFPT